MSALETPEVSDAKTPIVVAHLVLLPSELQVLVGGRRAGLTVREFQTLLSLARRPDHVVTRPKIYDDVWGGEMAQRERCVDVFVRKVRGKLANADPTWDYIHTHFGVGYRLWPEPI